VAAAELDGVAWRGEERSSAVGSGTRGSRECRVGWWSSRRWPAALHGGGRRRSVPAAEQAEEQGGGRGRLDWFVISTKLRGSTVKQKYLLN